jgi:hypothetical protein
VVLSSESSGREIFARYTANGNSQANGESTVIFQNKVEDKTGIYNPTTGIGTIQESGIYSFSSLTELAGRATYTGRVYYNLLLTGSLAGTIAIDAQEGDALGYDLWANKGTVVVPLVKGDTFEFRIGNGTGVTRTLVPNDSNNYFSIYKLSSSSQTIAAIDKVYVEAAGNGGTVLVANTTNIDFTETEDSHGRWNGTQFTAQSTRRYQVIGAVYMPTTFAGATIGLYKNGTFFRTIGAGTGTPDTLQTFAWSGSLTEGDVISFRLSGAGTLNNNTGNHWISITSE